MPELSLSWTLKSSSRMKSPYCFLVQRNELGVFGTVVPLFDQILTKLGITTTWVDLHQRKVGAELEPRG